MKLIVYGSKYGTTKKYAEEIARMTDIPAISYEKVSDINAYNEIIYLGALICAVMGILFHSIHFTLAGSVELITTFIGLYGMLIVRRNTENALGCIFVFLFIWNAI